MGGGGGESWRDGVGESHCRWEEGVRGGAGGWGWEGREESGGGVHQAGKPAAPHLPPEESHLQADLPLLVPPHISNLHHLISAILSSPGKC